MKRLLTVLIICLLPVPVFGGEAKPRNPVVRTCVIGGMTMTGLWPEIAKLFEQETGYKAEVVATGQRPMLADALMAGKADLLTMHSGDITSTLVLRGYGTRMRPWTCNDLVFVGPKSDPAGIRGLENGTEALKRIAKAKANLIDCHGIGGREVSHCLWRQAGLERKGDWILKDEGRGHHGIAAYCREHNAYVVIGRMPMLFKKMDTEGLEILVENDPDMRRPYIVMEADPQRFPDANHEGARALSDFLVSDKVQSLLARFRTDEFGGLPLFYPMKLADKRLPRKR